MLTFALRALIVFCISSTAIAATPIDLSGTWRFAIDREDVGTQQRWFDHELTGTITLPGSMTEHNLGDDVTTATKWTGDVHNWRWYAKPEYQPYAQPGNFKFPFWLTPKKHYIGPAWYQRDIEVSPEQAGKPLRLFFERAHWRTTAWLDDQLIGTRDSLSTPHQYDLPATTAGKHRLTICVDNRLQATVGVNAHSVSDHTQSNWNGIIGRMELTPLSPVTIDNLIIDPCADGRCIRVTAHLAKHYGPSDVDLELVCKSKQSADVITTAALGSITVDTSTVLQRTIALNTPVQHWSEFSPTLYEIHANVKAQQPEPATPPSPATTVTASVFPFAFREFKTSGTQFAVNGRPTFLRGTLECCIFPLTGYPPMTVDPWKRILSIARAHGLNHLRFHSWCPPEAAFQAADEMGFYYSIEVASWATVGKDPNYEAWLYAEGKRIVQEYGNHPSFCMMLYGNEPHGPAQKTFLAKWNEFWRGYDNRRLYSGGAGWPEIPENEFHVTPGPRISRHRKAINTRINAAPPETNTDYRTFIGKHRVPVISHEIGQWCVYPNFAERASYTGAFRALNFDIFEDSLKQQGMLDQAHNFLMASGKLQAICYKEEIESALRTPGMAGFQLLDLHDFPGQGTALVGVLDPFWNEKGYITPKEYRRFSGETVPLARLSKRVWTTDETLTASIEITHFGAKPIADAQTTWSLRYADGPPALRGAISTRKIPLGSAIPLGAITASLKDVVAPAKLVLEVAVTGESSFTNSWDIWVYPTDTPTSAPTDVLITRKLDAPAQATLAKGGKVLLMPERAAIKGDKLGPVAAGFSTIFWNTAWFPEQEPVTLGLLCDPKHAAFAKFPTEFHTNWQWWYLLHRSQCMLMDGLPQGLRPIVQMIDDWPTNRRLGLLFEAQYGGGKLMVCAADLETDLQQDPVARQFRASLLDYMASDKFAPQQMITAPQLETVLTMQQGQVNQ